MAWLSHIFKKEKSGNLRLDWLGTDMHSHLVPGIDDGSPDMVTSIELIKGFVDLGYSKVITTPHILGEVYPNTADGIKEGAASVNDALEKSGIRIDFSAAAEYFIDDRLMELLRTKTPLLTIGGNMVLVEFSMISLPLDAQEILFELQMNNYQPVIAHPERYTYLGRKKNWFEELKVSGCLLQLNLLSLTGHYGRLVQELAEHLVTKDMYDFAGTDLHHYRHLEALRKLGSSSLLNRLKDSGSLKNQLL